MSLNAQDFDTVASFRFYSRPRIAAIVPTGGPTLPAYAVTLRGTLFDGMSGVTMPFVPLCKFGDLVGQVLSQQRDVAADGVVSTTAVCVVPMPKAGASGKRASAQLANRHIPHPSLLSRPTACCRST